MNDTDELEIINWYECPICHHMSKDKKRIEDCLAQGKKNLYKADQKVEFRFVGQARYELRKIWFKAEIKGMTFRKTNHGISYLIFLSDSELPSSLYGRKLSIPEGYIRPI